MVQRESPSADEGTVSAAECQAPRLLQLLRSVIDGTMSAILERPARERDLVKAFEVALDKAREFEYELERMKVTFSVSDDACTAYFEVVPEPGHVVLGGDLSVKIDLNTKQVIDFERGQ